MRTFQLNMQIKWAYIMKWTIWILFVHNYFLPLVSIGQIWILTTLIIFVRKVNSLGSRVHQRCINICLERLSKIPKAYIKFVVQKNNYQTMQPQKGHRWPHWLQPQWLYILMLKFLATKSSRCLLTDVLCLRKFKFGNCTHP